MAGLDQRKVWDFAKVVFGGGKASPTGRVRATYLRTDTDGTHWVQLAGSSEETPVNGSTFAKASPGDVVELTMGDGVLSMSGNASDPAVGEAAASRIASNAVRPVRVAVNIAQGIAEAADKVAKAINQNFWTDTNGIHVTQVTREEWSNPTGESYQSGPNVLINSLGQLFRDGLNNLLTMTTESGARALAIWDGAGNAAANVLASFGETVTIGRSTSNHVEIDSDSVDISDGTTTRASFGANETTIGSLTSAEMYDEDWTEAIVNLLKVNGVPTFIIRAAYSGLDFTSSVVDLIAKRVLRINAFDSFINFGCPVGGIANTYPMTFHDGNGAGWNFDDENGDNVARVMPYGALVMAEGHGLVDQTTVTPAGGYRDETVTFDHAYDTAPTVIVGLFSTSGSSAIGSISVAVRSVTTTGFTARIFNNGTTDRQPGFYWIAMG